MARTLPVRFWSRVDTSQGPTSCWPWLGARSRKRCGTTRGHIRHGDRFLLAHRVALWLHEDPDAMAPDRYDSPYEACHGRTCTTRLCCNPTHLYWGSRQENEADRAHGRLPESILRQLAAAMVQTPPEAVPRGTPARQGCFDFLPIQSPKVSLPGDSMWKPLYRSRNRRV